ncbi:conserved hypothetical protein [uncultured Pleomorphomonas sp.]|uniref:YHS domain-containing protein n=1 Tax=uncultured Pleomorphomonas sp. TaxID=442121 RepID=A0A212LNE7_9HYPH|nr:conserved hypothetical protein [uncultured Pleomorphomonas sp.]
MSIQTNQTSRRQDWASFIVRAIVLSLFFLIPCQPVKALDERIVFDPYTGLSLGGYDPVAYFVSGAAVPGLADHEETYGDTYWHFATEGNAAAFRAAPAVYIPGFGGYALAAVARGVAQPGNPTLFAINRNRLYLFASEAERQSFLADPDAMIAAAAARWPDVLKLLAY